MGRLLAIPAILILLLGGAMIWSGVGRTQPPPADFTFISRGEIGTLDINSMSWMQDIRIAYALWEGLCNPDPVTFEPIPGCADRHELSADKTVYTFHIRPDARWSNGDPVVAGDFLFAWRRMLEEPGDYTYLFHYIRGARQYQEQFAAGQKPPFDLVAARALDDRTLRVTLNHPVTFFLDLMAFPSFFPMHEPSMRPFSRGHTIGHGPYDGSFTRPPHLVTNGAYRLESWEFHKGIRMVLNEHYWDRANVKCPIIDMLCYNDARTAFLRYEMGGIDWIAEVSTEDAADLRAIGRSDLHLFPGYGTYFYSINCLPTLPGNRPNPCADARVRRALAMAIDKRPIVQTITRLNQPIAEGYIPPDAFASYQPATGLPYDPQQARRLLAEAGYPGGRGFPRLTILFNTDGDHRMIAQNIRKQWADELGIEMEMGGVEIKTFRTYVHDKQFDIARTSWIGDYNDVSTFTDKYLSNSENNDSGWASPEYDRLCAEAAREADVPRRLELLHRAEQILCDEAPIIPLYFYVNAYLTRPNVSGIPLHPRNLVVFKSVEVKR